MTEKEIVREVMKLRGYNQVELAQKAGFPSRLNISGFLNNTAKGMRIDNFHKMLSAMDCEIVVRDKTYPKREWVLGSEDDEIKAEPREVNMDAVLANVKYGVQMLKQLDQRIFLESLEDLEEYLKQEE